MTNNTEKNMADKAQLKSMLNNIINDKTSAAELNFHDYITDKMREVAGIKSHEADARLKEADTKPYKLIIPDDSKLAKLSNKKKHDVIFGKEEGDDSFIQNQHAVTVEYIDIQGNVVNVYGIEHDWNISNQKALAVDFKKWLDAKER